MSPRIKAAFAIVLVCSVAISFIPGEASAFPYKIQGYLRNTDGTPIPMANISISGELYDMGTQGLVPTTYYRTTDINGYYVIYIAANEPGGFYMDSEITVSYDSGDSVASTMVTVTGLSTWANLTYDESSELGRFLTTPLGILIIVVSIAGVVGAYFYLNASDDRPKEENPRVERRRRKK